MIVAKTNTPFERWMVASNLRSIQAGASKSQVLATLRANGYFRVAAAVEKGGGQ